MEFILEKIRYLESNRINNQQDDNMIPGMIGINVFYASAKS